MIEKIDSIDWVAKTPDGLYGFLKGKDKDDNDCYFLISRGAQVRELEFEVEDKEIDFIKMNAGKSYGCISVVNDNELHVLI